MAEAYKCDRCRNFVCGSSHGKRISVKLDDYDLCDSCISLLESFLEGAEVDLKSLRMRPIVGHDLNDNTYCLKFICPTCAKIIDKSDADL